MKIIYSKKHLNHKPLYEIFNGNKDIHSEIPARIENIKDALKREGYKLNILKKTVPLPLIGKVHNKDYINFLKKNSPYSYPSVFPFNGYLIKNQITNQLAQMGKYSFDLYTP